MKIITLLFAIAVVTQAHAQSDLWTQADSLNGPPRANAAAFVILDNGWVVSGYDGFNKKKSMVSYDPLQDDWDDELSLGGASGDGLNRTSAMSFQAWEYGFVCMGEGEGFVFSDLWMYNHYTQTWTQMANFPGTARTQGVSFEVDNIGYVGLGKAGDFATYLKDLWSYDYLTNSWTQVADFPGTARIDAVGAQMGGKAYVGLGRDATSYPVDFYEYYPANDTWAQKTDFPGTARANACSFARFPQFFVTTGEDGLGFLNDTWQYNYFGDTWFQMTDFPGDPRAGAIALEIANRFYVGTGYGNGNYYDDFYEYAFAASTSENDLIEMICYPNPTTDNLFIRLDKNLSNIAISVYNISGQQVISETYFDQLSATTYSISLNGLVPGEYLIVLTSDNSFLTSQPVILAK
ncbi:MAG: T9SS type A sorting domain-containing protein [Crocinitomicaceae bacterium]|nr:T9SS type A sorting domain-containing protein [Crocinitomicaceae bacterium]